MILYPILLKVIFRMHWRLLPGEQRKEKEQEGEGEREGRVSYDVRLSLVMKSHKIVILDFGNRYCTFGILSQRQFDLHNKGIHGPRALTSHPV